jgi:hypothetical protein
MNFSSKIRRHPIFPEFDELVEIVSMRKLWKQNPFCPLENGGVLAKIDFFTGFLDDVQIELS